MRFLAALVFCGSLAYAHIGSPDIYLDGSAGPYSLFITVRPPLVIPGVAEIEVRASSVDVTGIQAVPMPMSGAGAKLAPVPDQLRVSPQDRQSFTGALWLMAPGSWQVRLTVTGVRGPASLSVPVPAAARAVKSMQAGLGTVLLLLGILLSAGVIAMTGASVREVRLPPGTLPSARQVRASRIAMGVSCAMLALLLWGGYHWWGQEATAYGENVYKPLQMKASLSPSHLLTLRLTDPGWLDAPGWRALFTRSVDDFVPDHNHIMHLYALRQPGLDRVYHLHPDVTGPGIFALQLPSMAAGTYNLYADVVHQNGFPETLVSKLYLESDVNGRALGLDEAAGSGKPWSEQSASDTSAFTLPDSYRMSWLRKPGDVPHARAAQAFRFRLTRPDGTPQPDMALYMGMLGHAAFVKTDGTVFAHIHPSGTVSMAALSLAQQQTTASAPADKSAETMGEMEGMTHAAPNASGSLPNEVTFPYGFPSAGRYRIFVQMKHGDAVETGIFDVSVSW